MPLTKTQVDMIEATGTPSSGNFLRGDGAWSNVGVSQLSATGTPSSSTFLRGDGSWNAPAASITAMTAQATTSGTLKDFTSIPAGVERITVMLSGVSTNGTSNLIVQLGTGATPTYTTTGYLGGCGYIAATTAAATAMSTGFMFMNLVDAPSANSGILTLTLLTGNTWSFSGLFSRQASTVVCSSAGSIPLAAALTAVRITTVNGTDTFDAGSVNILYDF